MAADFLLSSSSGKQGDGPGERGFLVSLSEVPAWWLQAEVLLYQDACQLQPTSRGCASREHFTSAPLAFSLTISCSLWKEVCAWQPPEPFSPPLPPAQAYLFLLTLH